MPLIKKMIRTAAVPVVLSLCILLASLLLPNLAYAQTVTAHRSSHQQVATHPAIPDAHASWYWNGIVVTLSRDDEFLLMSGGLSIGAIAGSTGIGLAATAALFVATWRAGWDYTHHQCDWYWLPYPGYGTIEMGTYSC